VVHEEVQVLGCPYIATVQMLNYFLHLFKYSVQTFFQPIKLLFLHLLPQRLCRLHNLHPAHFNLLLFLPLLLLDHQVYFVPLLTGKV
jgi:hypothetical protein